MGEGKHLADDVIEIHACLFPLIFSEHGPNAVDHLGGAQAIIDDALQRPADFVEVGLGPCEPAQSDFSVGDDRRQRLVDLMCDGRRHRAHCGLPGGARKLPTQFVQRLLGALELGDIPPDRVDLATVQGRGPGQAAVRSELVSKSDLETRCLAALSQMTEFCARLFAVVRVKQPLRRLAQKVLRGPTERRRPGRIDRKKPAFGIGNDEKIPRHIPDAGPFPRFQFDALLQRFIQMAQFLLGFDLFGYVGVGADPADDRAGLVADRQSPRQKPPVGAVLASERKCVLPRGAVFEALPKAPDDTIHVRGMVDFLPTPALRLLERRAGVIVPALVAPIGPALGVRRPGELTDVVGELAESGLAGDKRCFDLLTFGNFLGHHIDPEWLPVGVLEGMPAGDPDAMGAIRSLPADFDARDRRACLEDGLDQDLDLIGERREDLAHRPAQMIGDRSSANLGQTLVYLPVAAIGGQECQTDGCGVVEDLKGRQLGVQSGRGRVGRCRRHDACRC